MTARKLIEELLKYDNLDKEMGCYAVDRNNDGLIISKQVFKFIRVSCVMEEGFTPSIVLDTLKK